MTALVVLLLVIAISVAAFLLRRTRRGERLPVTGESGAFSGAMPLGSGATAETAPAASIVVQDGDTKLLQIVAWEADRALPSQSIAFPSQVAAALQPLLQLVPAATGAGYAGAGAYVVRFSPEAVVRLRDGTLELMRAESGARRAMAVFADGRQIFEHATLHSLSNLPLAAAAVWQGMAMVTAQKFLSDIDAKLKRIETGVTELRALIDARKLGRLQANLVYLLQLRHALPEAITSGRSGAYESELESIHRELLADTLTLRIQMESLLARIDTDAPAPSIVMGTSADPGLSDLLTEYLRLHRVQAFALLLSGLTTELRLVISGSPLEAEGRLGFVESEMGEQQKRVRALYRKAFERIRRSSSAVRFRFFRSPPKEEPARTILREIGGMNSRMRSEVEQTVRSVKTRAMLSANPGPLEVLVTTTADGQIGDVAWLPPGRRTLFPLGG